MRRSPRTRLLAASVATLATFALAACGDDDDTTDATDVTLSTEVDETTPTEDTATDDTIAPDDTTDATTDGTTSSSGGGEVGSQEEYLEAAREQLPIEDEEIRDCVAEALVSDDIYAAIQDAGMTVDTFNAEGPGSLGLDESAAQAVADDLAACGDLASQFSANADPTRLQCLEENMDGDQIAAALAFEILSVDPPAELEAAQDAVQECVDAASPTTTG